MLFAAKSSSEFYPVTGFFLGPFTIYFYKMRYYRTLMPRTNLCIQAVKCIFIPQQTCPITLSLCVSLALAFSKAFVVL